jgi:hypothetical protein
MKTLNIKTIPTYQTSAGNVFTDKEDALQAQNNLDLRTSLEKTNELTTAFIDNVMNAIRDYPELFVEWAETSQAISAGAYEEAGVYRKDA